MISLSGTLYFIVNLCRKLTTSVLVNKVIESTYLTECFFFKQTLIKHACNPQIYIYEVVLNTQLYNAVFNETYLILKLNANENVHNVFVLNLISIIEIIMCVNTIQFIQ